jgi:sarcosine oxidase delta subunit
VEKCIYHFLRHEIKVTLLVDAEDSLANTAENSRQNNVCRYATCWMICLYCKEFVTSEESVRRMGNNRTTRDYETADNKKRSFTAFVLLISPATCYLEEHFLTCLSWKRWNIEVITNLFNTFKDFIKISNAEIAVKCVIYLKSA